MSDGVKRERDEDEKKLAVKAEAEVPAGESAPKKSKALEVSESDSDDVPLAQLVRKKAPVAVAKLEDSSSEDVPLAQIVAKKKKQEQESKAKQKKKAAAKKPPPAKKAPKKKPKLDDSEDSSSEDIPLGQVVANMKKKSTPAKKATPAKKSASSSASSSQSSGKKKTKKEIEEEDIWEWWNDPPLPKGVKWRTLEHNGVIFAPPYEPHGVKMLYNGKPIELSPVAEERATHYARYLESEHVRKEQFNANFFHEFKVEANKGRAKADHITKFELCDFRPLKAFQDAEKERKKNRTKEEKDKEKAEKKELQDKYGYAVLDGHKQKVGNYLVEPPGIFLGRGNHPKTGMWKKRMTPDDVQINIGAKATIPPSPMKGHKWKEVVHRDTVTWLAGWTEPLQGNIKYVMLSAASRTKGMSDMAKFDKARKLRGKIDDIRTAYRKGFKSSNLMEQQRAVIVYIIDKLALRVGGEKDTDNTADTVGCTSLRVEHVELTAPKTLTLDFLGKDSMRFHQTVEIEELAFKCITKFCKKKDPEDQLFDEVNPSVVNDYLKEFMPGLSAKVFRTFNASKTLEEQLLDTPEDATIDEKVSFYNRANKEVALLCNHKRSLPRTYGESMEKLDGKIGELEADLEELRQHAKLVKANKTPKKRKDADGNEKPALSTDSGRIKDKIEKLEDRIAREKIKRKDKEDNAEVALGTSKINYNDPRITAAWCKKFDVPLSKVFSTSLRQKFPWAQIADADWKF